MSSNRDNKTSSMVTAALLTALVIVCTTLLKIPVGPDCYIHLGDAVIVLAVLMLPRAYACFAGAVGAMLSDFIGGFAFWAPWTFVIKLIMVLVLGFYVDLARRGKSGGVILGIDSKEFLGLLLSGLVAVLGYCVAERLLFGNWVPAVACIPFNFIQVIVGATIGELIYKRVKK